MGAHGIGSFQDDDGADFEAEILASRDIDIVIDALKAVPDEDYEYVENATAMRALVAAEMIADQMGHESGDIPDDLHSWIHEFGDADNQHVHLAHSAVDRILRKSETRDLWQDSQHFTDWLVKTRNLLHRLEW